jgi:hypothetical protein
MLFNNSEMLFNNSEMLFNNSEQDARTTITLLNN